jgi:hypothetical protein
MMFDRQFPRPSLTPFSRPASRWLRMLGLLALALGGLIQLATTRRVPAAPAASLPSAAAQGAPAANDARPAAGQRETLRHRHRWPNPTQEPADQDG